MRMQKSVKQGQKQRYKNNNKEAKLDEQFVDLEDYVVIE